MGEKLKRFGVSLKQTIKNFGASAEKVLNNPQMKKIEEDIEKATGGY